MKKPILSAGFSEKTQNAISELFPDALVSADKPHRLAHLDRTFNAKGLSVANLVVVEPEETGLGRWPQLMEAISQKKKPSQLWRLLLSLEPVMAIFDFGGRLSMSTMRARLRAIAKSRPWRPFLKDVDRTLPDYVDGVLADAELIFALVKSPVLPRAPIRGTWQDVVPCKLCWRLTFCYGATGHKGGDFDALCEHHRPSAGGQAKREWERARRKSAKEDQPPPFYRGAPVDTALALKLLKPDSRFWQQYVPKTFRNAVAAYPKIIEGPASFLMHACGMDPKKVSKIISVEPDDPMPAIWLLGSLHGLETELLKKQEKESRVRGRPRKTEAEWTAIARRAADIAANAPRGQKSRQLDQLASELGVSADTVWKSLGAADFLEMIEKEGAAVPDYLPNLPVAVIGVIARWYEYDKAAALEAATKYNERALSFEALLEAEAAVRPAERRRRGPRRQDVIKGWKEACLARMQPVLAEQNLAFDETYEDDLPVDAWIRKSSRSRALACLIFGPYEIEDQYEAEVNAMMLRCAGFAHIGHPVYLVVPGSKIARLCEEWLKERKIPASDIRVVTLRRPPKFAL